MYNPSSSASASVDCKELTRSLMRRAAEASTRRLPSYNESSFQAQEELLFYRISSETKNSPLSMLYSPLSPHAVHYNIGLNQLLMQRPTHQSMGVLLPPNTSPAQEELLLFTPCWDEKYRVDRLPPRSFKIRNVNCGSTLHSDFPPSILVPILPDQPEEAPRSFCLQPRRMKQTKESITRPPI
jgi:hypothetical protein